jgi:hypothetical protein
VSRQHQQNIILDSKKVNLQNRTEKPSATGRSSKINYLPEGLLAHKALPVGLAGFEPATPCPPDKCATKLRYSPLPLDNSKSLLGSFAPEIPLQADC